MRIRLTCRPIFLMVISFLFSIPAALLASCENQKAADLIIQADEMYIERLDSTKAQSAFGQYKEAVNLSSSCAEAAWKASRAAWWLGDQAEGKKEKTAFFQEGIDLAKMAVEIDTHSAAAHYWLAGNYGSYGEVRGVLKSLFLVKPIRSELEEILNINPEFDGGAAFRVLGVVDYKVPGFAGGSKKRAEEQLLKALEYDDQSPFNQYYMAEYYETVKEDEKAASHLDILDGLEAEGIDYADLVVMQEKGKELRKKLKI